MTVVLAFFFESFLSIIYTLSAKFLDETDLITLHFGLFKDFESNIQIVLIFSGGILICWGFYFLMKSIMSGETNPAAVVSSNVCVL